MVDVPKWAPIEPTDFLDPPDRTQEFRARTSEGDLDLTFWDDMTWVTIWSVQQDGLRGEELKELPASNAQELAEALVAAGVPMNEAEVLALDLWPSTPRARHWGQWRRRFAPSRLVGVIRRHGSE